MAILRFEKLSVLPDTFAPNTVYFIGGPDSLSFELFISDALGQSVRSGGKARLKVENVQNRTVVDSVSTRIFGSMKWLVQINGIGVNAGKRAVMEVLGVHNGNALVDATDFDFAVYAILKTDTFFDLDVAVVLVGAAQNQRMELLVESPSMAVDVHITREDAITL